MVGLNIAPMKSSQRIKLTIDSDTGIGIDECSAVSRAIYKALEDSGLVENFELEVSSPGIGEPLQLERQYNKNIGRLLKVTTADNKTITGKLTAVNPGQNITLEEQKKDKQKITVLKTTDIAFADIKKAAVEVSFN